MLSANDPFAPLFARTFEANYHPNIFQSQTELKYLVPQASPLTFYDRHIASHLALEHVVYEPSLATSLSRACDRAVQGFLRKGHKFCKTGYAFSLVPQRQLFRDAHTTCIYYNNFAADLCTSYAYKLVLNPEGRTWESPFVFIEEPRGREYRFTTEAWLAVSGSFKDTPERMKDLTDRSKKSLEDLSKKCPKLAVWQMFAMTHTATTMLRSLTNDGPFQWETCRTQGYRTTAAPKFPPDANGSVIPPGVTSRLKRRQQNTVKKKTTVKIKKTVTVPKLPSKPKPYRPDFRHYVQHAWATAAANDSTYMIFQCGRYERIGFRDRSSQTLYLSGVIDPINIKDTSYRKVHIGLHTVIVQDALERVQLSETAADINVRRREHVIQEVESPKGKKAESDSVVSTSEIYDEVANRDLTLVNLDYGAFLSPAPSSFLRILPSCAPGHAKPKKYPSQTRFDAHERVTLVLKDPLGQGAVGVVHPAVVTVTLKSGKVLKCDMAFKIAFTHEQRQKLYHEYQIYGHLSCKAGLEGIVTVHGLFKDPESGALGMLMDDAGQSLRRRELERGCDGRQVTTTPKEKEAFRRILQKLHEAGVRHHDIRADNLLVNSRNEVFLVDFDCADYEVSEKNKDHEMKCLNDLLEGRYQDGLYYSY